MVDIIWKFKERQWELQHTPVHDHKDMVFHMLLGSDYYGVCVVACAGSGRDGGGVANELINLKII